MDLDLWAVVVLAAVPACFEFHPISTQRLRASSSFSMKAHVASIPFLLVRRSTQLVNRLLNEGLGSTVIAVDDVLVVVQFVDMAHPSQVVPFGIGEDTLVLDDPLGDWASTSCAVVVMHDEVLGIS